MIDDKTNGEMPYDDRAPLKRISTTALLLGPMRDQNDRIDATVTILAAAAELAGDLLAAQQRILELTEHRTATEEPK